MFLNAFVLWVCVQVCHYMCMLWGGAFVHLCVFHLVNHPPAFTGLILRAL